MKVLIVGSGGREHTLAWKIQQSHRLTQLYCAPGNPGTARLGQNVPIPASDLKGLLQFARQEQIDLTVVGPEAPLVDGIVDQFEAAGLKVAGPSQGAARLEGSKVFAKDFMARHGVPTAGYQTYRDAETAGRALERGEYEFPVVVKADGLAAGKGVLICSDLAESLDAIRLVMEERKFGGAGDRVVIEEFLEGEELSFMVFTDGNRILPMVPSQDHKAIYDGDKGPNTGGMGAYSVDWILRPEIRRRVMSDVIEATIEGMAAEGHPFSGVLYAGLMLTADGPRVLEFNVRFGDPETQVLLTRLDSDLLEIFWSIAQGELEATGVSWLEDATVCVVLAASGYPGSYEKGMLIRGMEEAGAQSHTEVFQAGTAFQDNEVVSSGGRVLGVTSRGPDLREAIERAYGGVEKIEFDGKYYRRDIGAKGLARVSQIKEMS